MKVGVIARKSLRLNRAGKRGKGERRGRKGRQCDTVDEKYSRKGAE